MKFNSTVVTRSFINTCWFDAVGPMRASVLAEYNSPVMPATAHRLLEANTFCKMRATTASWMIHLRAAASKDRPTPKSSVCETKALKAMKAKPSPTLDHSRWVLA